MRSIYFKVVLSLLFIVAGFLHFFKKEFFLLAIPPYLPYPNELVLASGLSSLLLGFLLLFKRTTKRAAWGMILFLIAVFPAHIYMVMNPELFPHLSVALLWIRLPIQILLMLWAYRYAK